MALSLKDLSKKLKEQFSPQNIKSQVQAVPQFARQSNFVQNTVPQFASRVASSPYLNRVAVRASENRQGSTPFSPIALKNTVNRLDVLSKYTGAIANRPNTPGPLDDAVRFVAGTSSKLLGVAKYPVQLSQAGSQNVISGVQNKNVGQIGKGAAQFLGGAGSLYYGGKLLGKGGVRGVVGRAATGGALGYGMGTGAQLLTGGGLPTKKQAAEYIQRGVENSWTLAITNALTDKVLNSVAPNLVGNALTQPFRNGQIAQGFKQVFTRALAEVPAENTAFTFLDRLDGKSQKSFMEDWLLALPGNIVTNLAFAGAQGGWNTAINSGSKKVISDTLKSVAKKWNTPVTTKKSVNGKKTTMPLWKVKLKENQPAFYGDMREELGLPRDGDLPDAVREGGFFSIGKAKDAPIEQNFVASPRSAEFDQYQARLRQQGASNIPQVGERLPGAIATTRSSNVQPGELAQPRLAELERMNTLRAASMQPQPSLGERINSDMQSIQGRFLKRTGLSPDEVTDAFAKRKQTQGGYIQLGSAKKLKSVPLFKGDTGFDLPKDINAKTVMEIGPSGRPYHQSFLERAVANKDPKLMQKVLDAIPDERVKQEQLKLFGGILERLNPTQASKSAQGGLYDAKKPLYVDESGKNIVKEVGDYKIAANDLDNPTYLTVWKDGKQVGSLRTANKANGLDDYVQIGNVEVKPSEQGQGLATELYKTLTDYLPQGKKGIAGYGPDIAAKKAIPRIYQKLGGSYDEATGNYIFNKPNVAQQPLGDTTRINDSERGSIQLGPEKLNTLLSKKQSQIPSGNIIAEMPVSSQKVTSPQTPPEGQTGKPVGSSLDQPVVGLDVGGRPSSNYSYNINRKNLILTEAGQKKLNDVVEVMRPVLEKRRGAPLTNKEIIESGRKAKLLDDVMGRKEASDFAAKLQASRNYLKTASESKGVTPKYLSQLEIVSSYAADTGRRLRSFATSAEDAGIKEAVLKDLQKLGVETDRLIAAAKGVDWDDAKQVTEFYRKFRPASIFEKLEEYRYTNMLSSPNTHIVNTFSNFLQSAVVTPTEKTLTGGLDWIKSTLTGSERQYYASQGVDYTRGFWKSLPEAFDNFKNVISGKGGLLKPDIEYLPSGTSRLHQVYTTPLRALEAADQFFKTMIRGGEIESLKRVGIEGAEAAKLAENSAQYRTFRQAFDPDGKLGQGGLLKLWDKWNSGVASLRRLPGGRWIVPFLQTPTNILKQGVEYSPLGIATIPGSKEPLAQLSKAIIGSTVFATAYGLAESGVTTWDTPLKAKDRERFYSAGLQPYSIKMGDTWYSYSKLGPLSYPIAMAAAMKWAKDNGAEDDKLGVAGAGVGGFLQFFADQSYVQGIGDVIDAIRGDEFKQGRSLANIPAQLVPYRSLQGWIARLVDPIYRKTTGGTVMEQATKSIQSQIPVFSKGLEAYTTPTGELSRRSLPGVNALSPVKVSQQKFPYEQPIVVKKKTSSSKSAFDTYAAEDILPTNTNDFKILYEDAQRKVDGYKDNSSKIRTGLKDNQTLQEAQAELVEAKNMIRRMETENPEMVYKVGLDVYESGGGKTTVERADWAEKWLKASKDQSQYDSWYKEMLEKEVLTKSVAEELRDRGLSITNYVEGGKIKTFTGKGGSKKKITFKYSKVIAPKITIKRGVRTKAPTIKFTKPKIDTVKVKRKYTIKA